MHDILRQFIGKKVRIYTGFRCRIVSGCNRGNSGQLRGYTTIHVLAKRLYTEKMLG